MKKIILTGIKPTGTMHLGNYFGAIKPALELIDKLEGQALFFVADYHALNTVKNKETFRENFYDLAATWLACGLDKKNVIFYRQSDIPEIFELNWILSNVTPKGLMNRAHAYKATVDENLKNGEEQDSGINMGLYNYPILMAADILAMQTDIVPVGEDQKQHVEIAREIARIFDNTYGECLTLPNLFIKEGVGTIPGIDGRKMSKSYNNVIPLFSDENTLKKCINKIVTDSSLQTDPKPVDCYLFKIYELFASQKQIDFMKKRFAQGISWGEVKKEVFEVANDYLKEMREKYNYYLNNRKKIDEILVEGSEKARKIAGETLKIVRERIGK
ncbi:MAG: tryptophan--tRNA ligase [Clostridia bacterium]|nr:tryptophan--tRNA ligase [Clostridia bacterium]